MGRYLKFARTLTESITAYHGTCADFDKFSYDFAGKGTDQIGSGFYFSSDPEEAKGYVEAKRDEKTGKRMEKTSPTLMKVELDIKKPLDVEKIVPVSTTKMRKLLMMAPDLEDALNNWDDVSSLGIHRVLEEALPNYVQVTRDVPLVKALFNVANDFFRGHVEAFNKAVTKVLGYDGVVVDHGNRKHWLAFTPDQITIVSKEKVKD